MQKMKKLLFAFLISVVSLANVKAETADEILANSRYLSSSGTCSTSEVSEINKLFSKVRASYEIKEEKVKVDSYLVGEEPIGNGEQAYSSLEYFKINITNITEKLYVIVTDDYNNESKIYNSTEDGIVSFDWRNIDKVVNFKITVLTSNKTSCPNEKVGSTIVVRTPRYNSYSNEAVCGQYPDFDLCQRYVTFNDISIEEYNKRLEEYEETKYGNIVDQEENLGTWERIKKFIIDNKYYFIGGGVGIIIIAGVAVVVVVKKRRSSEL